MRRFNFLAEIAVLYLIVCAIGWFFNGGAWSYPGVALHPFLIVVAIEANQYGLRPAILTSVVGLLLYLIGSPGLSNDDSVPMLAIMATGVLFGMTQESRNRQLRDARNELDRSRTEQDRLRQRIQILTQANNELNERILGEVNTVSSFSEIARRLSVLEQEDLFPAICELINDYLSASKSSVYSLSDGVLTLESARGFVVIPEDLKSISNQDSLAWHAVNEKTSLSALDLLSRKGTAETPARALKEGEHPILMASPIFDEAEGRVTGVVCVNNLPFSKFHGASKKILGVIARWAGDALNNAAIVEGLRARLSAEASRGAQ